MNHKHRISLKKNRKDFRLKISKNSAIVSVDTLVVEFQFRIILKVRVVHAGLRVTWKADIVMFIEIHNW